MTAGLRLLTTEERARLTTEERLAMTQAVVDRWDCPVCTATAGALCLTQQDTRVPWPARSRPARDLRRTHLARLGLYDEWAAAGLAGKHWEREDAPPSAPGS